MKERRKVWREKQNKAKHKAEAAQMGDDLILHFSPGCAVGTGGQRLRLAPSLVLSSTVEL